MRHRFLQTLVILALCFFAGNRASAYYYKQYTVSNGLLSNNVYHAFRDSKGYMWFFTDKGVSKFDGANFKNFTVFDGLSDEDAYTGYEDKLGRLWIFTANGNPCFIKNDTVFNAGNNALLKKMPGISFMISILEQKDSSIYIAYLHGQIIKVHGNDFKYIVKQPAYQLYSLIDRSDTIIAFGCNVTYSFCKGAIVDFNTCEINDNYHDSRGILKAIYSGIEIYNDGRLTYKLYDSTVGFLKSLHVFQDDAGNLFCCTKNGLSIINITTRKKDKLFDHTRISSAAQDIYGNYWITTLDHGIYCLHKDLDNIKSLDKVSNSLPVILNNGQFFFLKNNSIYHLANKDSLTLAEIPLSFNAVNEPVYLNEQYFFYKDHHELFCFNLKTSKTDRFDAFRYIYPLNSSKLLCLGKDQLGTIDLSDKIVRFNVERNNYIKHKNAYNSNRIFFDKENYIYRYDLQTKNITTLDVLNYSQSIHKMYYIRDQLIVITNDQKIILYDSQKNYKKYTLGNYPFVCYDISSIETPRDQKYLLNTNKGYYIVDDLKNINTSYRKLEYPAKSSDVFAVYTLGPYLICNINSSFYLINDSLANKKQQEPVFYIENISINGNHVTNDHPIANNTLQNHIAVSLNCLKFNNVNNSYQYKIIRKKDTSGWYNSASDKLDILLEKDGDYSIEIRTITENNIASPSKYISFTITPPFYRTITFSVITGVLIVLAIYLGIVLYNRRRKKVFENELDYLQLEHKAINSLLNPHFIFNAINNIQHLINIDSKETANNYLAILSKLIRQNIENLQFSFIPVSKEITLVKNYIHLQNLRFGNRITLEINEIPGTIENINIPPLLIHTFVENSVVHGFKKATGNFVINIEFSLSTDDYLIINIKDNGTGLTADRRDNLTPDKLSLGIDFIRKRLTRISAFYNVDFSLEIHNIESPGQGAEVVIILYSKFRNEITNTKQG